MLETDQLATKEYSVALTSELERSLADHLDQMPGQEDLSFAIWRPSHGAHRLTAVASELFLPGPDDRILQGNAAFTSDYARRVLSSVPDGAGLAFIHSHLGPGWQGMSEDDVVAERDRLAGAAFGRTGLPLVGLTKGTDDSWSARFWLRQAPHQYERRWAESVRSVGRRLRQTFHPKLVPAPDTLPTQVASISVWGESNQRDLARTHVGVVGLGSVGSIVSEGLARMGVERITLIDHDSIEDRNLDRTLGSTRGDAAVGMPKVKLAGRRFLESGTSRALTLSAIQASLLEPDGLAAALDCDVLISCVDRPWPRFLLNVLSYAHLIPVIDGGIFARVKADGRVLHVDWRIHTVSPEQQCLYCLGALLRSDVALDMEGKLEDPDYLKGLSQEERDRLAGRNVFPFSLSVASHELLQLVGLISGSERIGGIGPQHYQAYPGVMTAREAVLCDADCDVVAFQATACDLSPNLP